MKIKNDFVTNSSSTSFVISITKDVEHKFIEFMDSFHVNDSERYNESGIGYVFENIQELQEYTNNGPVDWVKRITGPKFVNMRRDNYEKCLAVLKDSDNIIYYVFIDSNTIEKFSNSEWYNNIIICL